MLSSKSKLILTFFLVFIVIGIYAIFSEEEIHTSDYVCPINYGKPECINETLFIPFFNPNSMELNNIQVIVRTPEGSDIFNVDKSLVPGKTEVLQLVKCYDINNINVKWCCDDICCEEPLKDYSADVELVK